jgi:hypothetical protein
MVKDKKNIPEAILSFNKPQPELRLRLGLWLRVTNMCNIRKMVNTFP